MALLPLQLFLQWFHCKMASALKSESISRNTSMHLLLRYDKLYFEKARDWKKAIICTNRKITPWIVIEDHWLHLFLQHVWISECQLITKKFLSFANGCPQASVMRLKSKNALRPSLIKISLSTKFGLMDDSRKYFVYSNIIEIHLLWIYLEIVRLGIAPKPLRWTTIVTKHWKFRDVNKQQQHRKREYERICEKR